LIETTNPCETIIGPATKFVLRFAFGGLLLFSRSV